MSRSTSHHVSTPRPPNQESNDSSAGLPATLGGLLYPEGSAAPPAEAEWDELLRGIARGEPQALRELYERTHRAVFTYAARIARSRETAEEIALDVYLDVWRRAAAYDPATGSVMAWIMNQTRSRAIDRLRLENRRKRVNPFPETPAEPAGDESTAVARDDRRRALSSALTLLTLDERNAIESAYFCDNSYAEAAQRLGQPAGTVKTRIRSGLAKLREELAEQSEDL